MLGLAREILSRKIQDYIYFQLNCFVIVVFWHIAQLRIILNNLQIIAKLHTKLWKKTKLKSYGNYRKQIISKLQVFSAYGQFVLHMCKQSYLMNNKNQTTSKIIIVSIPEICLLKLLIFIFLAHFLYNPPQTISAGIVYNGVYNVIKMRVLVIGAGLSGLTTARELLKAAPNVSVTVTQALNRVGGRTNTVNLNGCKFDLGAEFIGQSQTYIKELAEESGNGLIKTFRKGAKLTQLNNTTILQYEGILKSPQKIWQGLKLKALMWRINYLAAKVPLLNPNLCQYSKNWDKLSVQEWVNQNVSAYQQKFLFQMVCRGIFGTQTSEISFLYFLLFVHQNKNLKNLIDVQHALQEYNTKLGTQYFSVFLADQVRKMGGNVQLGTKIKNVQQKDDKCFVKCVDGKEMVCDYLVMACSPSQANKIHYHPPLSKQRKLICEKSFMGSYIKMIILYKKAYWRQKGLSGEMATDCKDSPIVYVYDDSKNNEQGQLQPALEVFVGGNVYRQWKKKPHLQKQITSKLAALLDQPEMMHPIAVEWKAWEEQQTIGGGPTGNFGPGVLTQISDLRKPEKRIHWAGTELATVSMGYMDGAVESGKRAATEVLSRLNGEPFEQSSSQKSVSWRTKYFNGVRKWLNWI